MAATPLPSPDELRQIFSYDPQTGKLIWRFRPRHMFQTDASWLSWNGKHHGKEAFACPNTKGYHSGRFLGYQTLAHRVAWAYMTGAWPTHQIDHINHDRSDNRWANLRQVSSRENQMNMRRNANNTSGHTGVRLHKPTGKWRARITVKGKEIDLGAYINIEDAVAAREAASARFGFHPNHGT